MKFIEDFHLLIKQFCLIVRSFQKNTGSKNPKVVKKENGIIIFLSKCGVCDSEKS